jgi:hypothetical protein
MDSLTKARQIMNPTTQAFNQVINSAHQVLQQRAQQLSQLPNQMATRRAQELQNNYSVVKPYIDQAIEGFTSPGGATGDKLTKYGDVSPYALGAFIGATSGMGGDAKAGAKVGEEVLTDGAKFQKALLASDRFKGLGNNMLEKAISVLRPGQAAVGADTFKTGKLVARERFNIPALKKIGAGSDRDVYDLGNGNVMKVTKTSRGLTQNVSSADYYAEDAGLIPQTIEQGKNYLVKEKIAPPDANTKAMVKELQNLSLTRGSDYYTRTDYAKEQQRAIEILNKYGYPGDEVMNYGDVLWGDFKRIKNWGTKDGKPMLIDEGSLNGQLTTGDQFHGQNLRDPEFRDIYNQSRAAKLKFGDADKNTMYGIGAISGASMMNQNQQQQ